MRTGEAIELNSGSTSSEWGMEERRALFVLGLIAALATIRFGAGVSWQVSIGDQKFNVIPIIDVLLGWWLLYEFFMVLGISAWKDLQQYIIDFARLLFLLGLLFIVTIGSVLFLFSYPPFSFYLGGLLLAWLIGQSASSIRRHLATTRDARKGRFRITVESLAKIGAYGSGLVLLTGLSQTQKLLDPQHAVIVMIIGICCVTYLSWKKRPAAE